MSTLIIAEIGINHNGNLNKAKKLVLEAKNSGANAVKFQTYISEKRVSKDNPIFDILKKCQLSFEDHIELSKFCLFNEIEYFSTPFDEESLKFEVETIKSKRIKISSFDVSNLLFLRKINKLLDNNNFSIIMSTGMANLDEINIAIKNLNTNNLSLLHCISSYPMKQNDANLSCISHLKHITNSKFKIGYSDHSNGIEIPSLAVMAGATIIEKHFTLDKNDDSVDNAVSANPKEFLEMVDLIRNYEQILGNPEFKLRKSEKNAEIFKRCTI